MSSLKFAFFYLLLLSAFVEAKKKNKKTATSKADTVTAAAGASAAAGFGAGFLGGFAGAGGFSGGSKGGRGGNGGPGGFGGSQCVPIPPFAAQGTNVSFSDLGELFEIAQNNTNSSKATIQADFIQWASDYDLKANFTEFYSNLTTLRTQHQTDLLSNVSALPAALEKIFAIQSNTSITCNETATQIKAVFTSLSNSTARLLGLVLSSAFQEPSGPGGKGGFSGGKGGFDGGFGGSNQGGRGGAFGGFQGGAIGSGIFSSQQKGAFNIQGGGFKKN